MTTGKPGQSEQLCSPVHIPSQRQLRCKAQRQEQHSCAKPPAAELGGGHDLRSTLARHILLGAAAHRRTQASTGFARLRRHFMRQLIDSRTLPPEPSSHSMQRSSQPLMRFSCFHRWYSV
eukprot:CAMPEP_0170289832 /NCGR_PEP_ID=MMETSP0116_2-20130129/44989_1 /TAXON_ID=400756 /ORGANISM="Durinskia baltica, Strain CSIRO CS-38" /LENGTH=119 /DNA_ID=CAMNT_0010541281 /DNA_START=484 /DNA_END=843 /DNA_ORIENTATION=-